MINRRNISNIVISGYIHVCFLDFINKILYNSFV